VLERRPGQPLAELAAAGALPATGDGAAEWIAAQVLQGLAELAEHGWIHGDLGPANLLLAGSRASLLDLGLARSHRDEERRRSGTLRVMAPEILASGLPHPRSDMFSLGVLLFQLLTGRAPFPDDPGEALPLVLAGRVGPAGEAAGHALLPLVMRCLQAEPARRPEPAEALAALLPALPRARQALLLPRRGPGAWHPAQLDQALERLGTGLAWLAGGGGGTWRAQLDQLLLEAAERSGPLLAVRREAGQSLLDWLARRVGTGERLRRYPELSVVLERRVLNAEALRQVLAFLDDQLERPRQGLCWISGPGDPDAALLPALLALCRHQRRPLALLTLDGAPWTPDDCPCLRLEPPREPVWRGWLRRPAPGLELDDPAAGTLDRLCRGDGERLAPLLARAISAGSLELHGTHWRLAAEGPAWDETRDEDWAGLPGAWQRALYRACAWLEPAPPGLWGEAVAQGRAAELEALEGSGWLRDRGDGQLAPRAGLREGLDAARLAQAHLELLHELWRRPEPPADLCLLHLGRVELAQTAPELACGVLLRARGLVDPGRKLELIRRVLPGLAPAQAAALESALASALLERGRPAEARGVLRGLLRRSARALAGPEGPSPRMLVLKLAHVYGALQRPRLALRLLERAAERAAAEEDRLALTAQTLPHLLRLGRRQEAAEALHAIAESLLRREMGGTGLPHAVHTAGTAAFQLGLPELAARLWNHLDRGGRSELQVQQRVWLANNLGVLHLKAGRLEQARMELEQAGREAGLYHLERYELMARVNLSLVQLQRGAADQAVRELEPALTQARELLEPETELAVLDHLGEAWAALGDLEGAERFWRDELRLARDLKSGEDELEPLKRLLCLSLDLGLEAPLEYQARFRELCPAGDSPLCRQWAVLRALGAPEPPRGQPREALPEDAPVPLKSLAAGREPSPDEVLRSLLELEPRLDGMRVALALLEGRLAWLSAWAPRLRELRESHRLHQIRLLALEGELAARREDWVQAGGRLGRATHLLEAIAVDLSPAWQERLAASPWLRSLLARSAECLKRLDELERSEHGHAAGAVGSAAGA
jgi:tetratricopeptide (TPR) repeat protein